MSINDRNGAVPFGNPNDPRFDNDPQDVDNQEEDVASGDGRAAVAPPVSDGNNDVNKLTKPVDRWPSGEKRDTITTNRHDVVEREKEEFSGIKFGSAFFGWLTATGMAVILTAILAAIGAGVGLGTNTNVNKAAKGVTSNPTTVGIISAIVLAVILFAAYYCGGYVAGRMARFNGAKQGLAVWIWAVAIAIVVAIITAIAGAQANVLGSINAFPRIPMDEGTLTITSIVTVIVVALIALLGALVGGLAGMRYHRKVDRVGLGR